MRFTILFLAFLYLCFGLYLFLNYGALVKDDDISQELLYVFENEGRESKHPNDDGGYTKYGISQNFHPTINVKSFDESKAKKFYEDNFWNNTFTPYIKDKLLRAKFFDTSVWMGYHRSTKLLQRAVLCNRVKLIADGSFGNLTIAAVNSCNPEVLIATFTSEIVNFVEDLQEEKPQYNSFIKGWLNRAYKLPNLSNL